jgi:hypothetical protein
MTAKTGFDALLEEINGLNAETADLAKAFGDDADKMAAEGDDDDDKAGESTAADDDAIAEAAAEGDEDGEPMGKSFQLTLADGTVVDAVDGAEMIKSLAARLDANEAATQGALGAALTLIKGQGALIKSMSSQMSVLANKGAGRKTVLTINERTPAATPVNTPEQSAGLNGTEFMAKAMGAMTAGRLTARDIAVAETYINNGEQPPAAIVQAVMSAG